MGGIESVAFELTEGLNRLGIASDVLCAGLGRRTIREQAASGYQITRAGSLGRLLSTSMSPALLWETRRIIDDYDIVHVHMPDPMAALALRLTQPRARLVIHWHSDVVNQRRALRLYEPLQRWLLRRADAIIATSPPYAESSPWLQPWKHKVVVIPIGISEPKLVTDDAQIADVRSRFGNRKLVFSLGRMTYYKGFDILIEAAARLNPDIVIAVGGGGELLERHRAEVARRGLSNRIQFLGRLADADIPAYFSAADVFCLPSTQRSEAFGVVLLEAMAMALPIVATNIAGSGAPWVNRHKETGMTVPPGNAEALANALNLLLGDDEMRRRYGRAGRRLFEEEFTAATMVNRVMRLYENVVRGSGGFNSDEDEPGTKDETSTNAWNARLATP
jgi:rhamnosyl/mannosyltransferase